MLKIKGIIDDTHMEDKKVAIIFLDQQITSLELNMSGLSTSKSLVLASYLGCVLECSLKIQKVHPNERFISRFATITRSIRQECSIAPKFYC